MTRKEYNKMKYLERRQAKREESVAQLKQVCEQQANLLETLDKKFSEFFKRLARNNRSQTRAIEKKAHHFKSTAKRFSFPISFPKSYPRKAPFTL